MFSSTELKKKFSTVTFFGNFVSWFTSLLQLEIGPSGSIYIIGKHGKSGLFYFPQRWLLNIYQNTTASSLLILFLEVGVQSFFFPNILLKCASLKKLPRQSNATSLSGVSGWTCL